MVFRIADELSMAKAVGSTLRQKKKRKTWQIILLVIGSPLWLSFIVAAVCVFLGAYVVLWSAVFTFYAVFASLAVFAVGCLAGATALLFTGHPLQWVFVTGAMLMCAGLAVPFLFGSNKVAKGTVALSGGIWRGLKRRFAVRRERV